MRLSSRFASVIALCALLAACGITPDKPVRPTLYDFGPDAVTPAGPPFTLPAIVLADVEAAGGLEGAAMLYRLAYADAHELKPYAFARWSAPPALLVRQRLREQLGRDRMVLDLGDAAALARADGRMPRQLRVELEEFSHVFQSPQQSVGYVRLRCTLLENTAAGDKLLAQRTFTVQRPAPSADPSGGVRGLTAAIDGAAAEIGAWLGTVPPTAR
jgi:cholesterol transport system auxiliary component